VLGLTERFRLYVNDMEVCNCVSVNRTCLFVVVYTFIVVTA